MVVCWVRQPFFLWRHFRLFAASPLRRGGCGLFAAIRGAESLPILVALFGSIMISSISWFLRAGINAVNHPLRIRRGELILLLLLMLIL